MPVPTDQIEIWLASGRDVSTPQLPGRPDVVDERSLEADPLAHVRRDDRVVAARSWKHTIGVVGGGPAANVAALQVIFDC